MDDKKLKTSVGQRIVIIVIALLLLGSTVLTYAFIVVSNGNSNSSSTADVDKRLEELSDQFDEKNTELAAAAKPLSDKYFKDFVKYKSNVKAYNETAANEAVLSTRDLKQGTGATITEGSTNYMAYYIGWCPDGSIFDSSFDNQGKETDQPDATALNAPLDPSIGLIEGWNQGIVGMKIGGVREITMSGSLAYGSTQEICGGYNKPLKFIVMPIERDAEIIKLSEELSSIRTQILLTMYGASS